MASVARHLFARSRIQKAGEVRLLLETTYPYKHMDNSKISERYEEKLDRRRPLGIADGSGTKDRKFKFSGWSFWPLGAIDKKISIPY
jgi:hypothetical protein